MMHIKITPKQMAVAAVMLFVLLLIVVFTAGAQPKPLHTGWYKTAWLVKHGYNVPAGSPKRIYLRRTADSAKANIKPAL